MKTYGLAVVLLGAVLLGGCTKYEWGGYDKKLLSYYKHQDNQKLETALERIADKAEKSERVPPGLYAEVGYLLYELDQPARAVEYFQKEKDLWPESAVIMDKMIRNAQNPPATASM